MHKSYLHLHREPAELLGSSKAGADPAAPCPSVGRWGKERVPKGVAAAATKAAA